jgi:hypothetical protein
MLRPIWDREKLAAPAPWSLRRQLVRRRADPKVCAGMKRERS